MLSVLLQLLEEGRQSILYMIERVLIKRCKTIESPLVILSACNSGFYEMAWGDFSVGAAPDLLRAGANLCIGARFPVGAKFAERFCALFAVRIASGKQIQQSFSDTLLELEASGEWDLWKDLGCFELLRRS